MKRFPSVVFLIIAIAVLVGAIAILYAIGSNVQTLQNNTPASVSTPFKLNITDIVDVTVHSGLDIECPDLKGVAQHGYAYTVTLRDKRILERIGCGVGTPEIYASAIAQDLELHGNFEAIDEKILLDKLIFKIYDANSQ
jgi:hypothetical protein